LGHPLGVFLQRDDGVGSHTGYAISSVTNNVGNTVVDSEIDYDPFDIDSYF